MTRGPETPPPRPAKPARRPTETPAAAQSGRDAGTLNACDELLGPAIALGLRDAPALLHRDAVYSYGELETLVNRFANALRHAHIGFGERVLFMLKDTPELVAGFLAAMKIGGVAVALNTRYSAADLGYALADTGSRTLFIHSDFLPILDQAVAEGAPRPPTLVVCDPEQGSATSALALNDFLTSSVGPVASAPTAPDDMAFWVYTSGTTGKAKAAVHRHRDVLIADVHLGEVLGIRPQDKLFSSSKLFFTFALAHCLLGGLRVGATLILDDRWPHTEAIAEIVARHRPDVMFSVPTIYRNLLAEGRAESDPFRAIRTFVSAGERLPPAVLAHWREATGTPILDGIGATETLFLFVANTPNACRPGATGRPQPGVELRLVDDQERPIAEPGQLGVLWVRMGSVAAQYWNRPDKNAASFEQGWYRTGDMFSFDADGWWYHHGRSDDLFKVSGQWVSPTEIEDCAMATAGATDVAVIGAPNEDGLTRLVMFVAAQPDCDTGDLAARIQEHLKANLSIFKCPRNIQFISEIPRTATGKIQRFRLREIAEDLRHRGALVASSPRSKARGEFGTPHRGAGMTASTP